MTSVFPQHRRREAPAPGFLGLSRATVFWELRLNRSIYLLAVLGMVVPLADALRTTLALILHQMAQYPHAHLWITQGYTLGLGYAAGNTTIPVVVAGALGFAVIAVERLSNRVVWLLESPVRRRDVLRAKMTLVVLTILVAAVVSGMMVAAVSLRLGGLQFGAALLHLLLGTAMAMGPAMTMLAAATVIANAAIAAAAVLAVMCATPSFATLASAIGWATHWSPASYGWLDQITILPLRFPIGIGTWPYVAAYCAWALIMAWVAFVAWDRVRAENVVKPFAFPFLWRVYYGGLAAVSALILTWLLHRWWGLAGAGSGLGFALLGAALWFGWRWFTSHRLLYRDLH